MAPQNHPPKPQATHPQDGAAPGRTPSIKGPGQSPVALGGLRPVPGGCDLPPLWQEFPRHSLRQTGSHPGSGPQGLPLAGNERPEARAHPVPGAPQVSLTRSFHPSTWCLGPTPVPSVRLTWRRAHSARTCRRCGCPGCSWSGRPRWYPAHAGCTGNQHAPSGGASSAQGCQQRPAGSPKGRPQPHQALARARAPASRWAPAAGRRAWRQCGRGRVGSRKGSRARSLTGRSWRAPGPRVGLTWQGRGGGALRRGQGGGQPPATAPDKSPLRRPQPSPIVVQAEPSGASQTCISMSCRGKPCRGKARGGVPLGFHWEAGDPILSIPSLLTFLTVQSTLFCPNCSTLHPTDLWAQLLNHRDQVPRRGPLWDPKLTRPAYPSSACSH